jgi:hypothetical protein
MSCEREARSMAPSCTEEVRPMEHRWGTRLSTTIPVRLRCLQSPDTGCRCLGFLENVSVSGALIRTEPGISPSAHIAVEPLTPALGLKAWELPACVIRGGFGQLAVEWMDVASTGVLAVLSEADLLNGYNTPARPVAALGRVRFCALAPARAV